MHWLNIKYPNQLRRIKHDQSKEQNLIFEDPNEWANRLAYFKLWKENLKKTRFWKFKKWKRDKQTENISIIGLNWRHEETGRWIGKTNEYDSSWYEEPIRSNK